MAERTEQTQDELQQLLGDVEQLRQRVVRVHQHTQYEDLEHADLGLQIVHHALEEVVEHTGLGGHIEPTSDPEAHRKAEGWVRDVRRLRQEAQVMLTTHPSEDLETALKALEIAEGSLDEIAERYG
jgi:hypothetical protein